MYFITCNLFLRQSYLKSLPQSNKLDGICKKIFFIIEKIKNTASAQLCSRRV